MTPIARHENTETTATTATAVVQSGYGTTDRLHLDTVELAAPEPDQVLVDVHAASVNPVDWHGLTGSPAMIRTTLGLRHPNQPVLGSDMAGVVRAIGADVGDLAVGDRVFGEIGRGAFAAAALARAPRLARIPDGVTDEQAATLPVAGLTALQSLRDRAGMAEGDSVLVVGASGGVGMFAVQIARALGASRVDGVCSAGNVEMVRSIGADRVYDYTSEDYTETPDRYDVVIDNVGNRSLRRNRRLMTAGGRYVMVSGPKWPITGPLPKLVAALVMSRFVDQTLTGVLAAPSRADLEQLAGLVASGAVEPIIDRTVDLEGVPAAMERQGRFHAAGKTVVVP